MRAPRGPFRGAVSRSSWSTCMNAMIGLGGALALVLLGLASPPAIAAMNAGKTLRIVVPFAPSGSSDVLARLMHERLQQALNETVIIENHAGAGSNIGTTEVARARPDGETLLLTSSAFVVNPALYKNVPYDFAKDFVPIAALPVAPNVFATSASNGIGSLSEVISRAKADPQKLNYASPGNGTTPQLAMELFKLKAGIHITNIAYNGGGPATQALLTGTVDVLSTALPGAIGQVRSGTMKGIAVTTAQRWPTLPDVPTFVELGFPDITLSTEHFLLAPAGTPPERVERLTKATLAVLAQDDVRKRVVELGYEPCRRSRRRQTADRQRRVLFQGSRGKSEDSANPVMGQSGSVLPGTVPLRGILIGSVASAPPRAAARPANALRRVRRGHGGHGHDGWSRPWTGLRHRVGVDAHLMAAPHKAGSEKPVYPQGRNEQIADQGLERVQGR